MEISEIDAMVQENEKKKADIDAESKALLKIKKRLEKENSEKAE